MTDWTSVQDDPFADAPKPRAAPRTSLTVHPATKPPPVADWTSVEHDPFAGTTQEKAAPPAEEEKPKGFLESFQDSAANASRTFANDLHRSRSAASQGTTPNLEAHKENLISDNVVEGDDGNLHYIDDDGRLQPTDTNKHVALTGNDGKIRVYKRTDNTDEGRLSAAGRLLTTGMVTETPRVGTEGLATGARVLGIGSRGSRTPNVHPGWLPPGPVNEAIQSADRLGVNLPQAIASDSRNVNYVGQAMSKAPGGAPLQHAIEQGLQGDQGLAGALRRTAVDAGGVADVKTAGEGVSTGLEDVFKPESQRLVKQLYDRVDSLVNPSALAPLTETHTEVGNILGRRLARGNKDNGAAVDSIMGALQRPGGLTYEAMKDLRSSVRELKEKGEKGGLLPVGMSQRELEQIYNGLTRDLGNAAEVTGGPAARAAWERANTLSSERVQVLDTLNKVLGSKLRSDEGVFEVLHRMAGTGAGADIDTLRNVRSALQGIPGVLPGAPRAWENVASTVVSRLGRNSQGQFSPNIFITDYNELSPAARRMLFQGVGRGNVVGALDDIARVSERYVASGKLANSSGTAGHSALLAALTGAVTSAVHGDVLTPIGIGAAILGSNVVSRLLGAPATANSVARWTRSLDALAQTPGYRSWAAYNIASRNLANTTAAAAGDPSLAPQLVQQLQGAVRRPNERQDQGQQ